MLKSRFFSVPSILVLTLLVGTSISTLSAEPTSGVSFGRQTDGRAFRVDANGFRVVDELAELEVRNKDLEEQVLRLQKKLADTPAELESKRSAENQPPSCDDMVSTLYMRVASLQEELEQKEQGLTSLPLARQVSSPATQEPAAVVDNGIVEANLLSDENGSACIALQSKLSELQSEHSVLQSECSATQAELTQLTASSEGTETDWFSKETELSRLEKELKEKVDSLALKSKEASQLEAKVAKLSTEVSTLNKQLDTVVARTSVPAAAPSARARLRSEPIKKKPRVRLAKTSDTTGTKYQSSLKRIQKLIFQRKSQFDSLARGGRGVSVSMQKLETKKRRSLGSLRRQIARFNSGKGNDSGVAAGLTDIEQVLRSDIKVLKRLAK